MANHHWLVVERRGVTGVSVTLIARLWAEVTIAVGKLLGIRGYPTQKRLDKSGLASEQIMPWRLSVNYSLACNWVVDCVCLLRVASLWGYVIYCSWFILSVSIVIVGGTILSPRPAIYTEKLICSLSWVCIVRALGRTGWRSVFLRLFLILCGVRCNSSFQCS